MSEATAKRHMGLRTSRAITNTAIHILLIAISIIWLIPFVCIVLQSFRVESTGQVGYVIPKVWGVDNYTRLFSTDFTRWYTNTFIAALVTALIQTIIVLCMSYTLSRFRFKISSKQFFGSCPTSSTYFGGFVFHLFRLPEHSNRRAGRFSRGAVRAGKICAE